MRVKNVPEMLTGLLFPRRCPVCDRPVKPFGEYACTECIRKVRPISPPRCLKCGKKIRSESALCADCTQRKRYFDRGRILYEYDDAAGSVYRFKYSGRREYAESYARDTVRYLGDYIASEKPDVLVPIPIHRKRYRKRGYNQAFEYAEALSRLTDIPVGNDIIKRVKNTIPLKLLGVSERQINLKNAFIVPENVVKLNKVMLVDDIFTTGASINEAARVLKMAGVREVCFVTLAGGAGI